jgi:hypothetical protein
MPTTSNFGWTTPADTDLVKDGAAAIRTLGNGIDTSFLDLKGGTTGQVLSKASNTDLDFSWVAQDDSNAIQNAIVDAKGDLISATAADTPARLAVGANGTVLTADSTEATGLKWVAPASGGGMTLLQTNTLSGASYTTASISQDYKHLLLLLRDANSSGGDIIRYRFNSDTSGNYYYGGVYVAQNTAFDYYNEQSATNVHFVYANESGNSLANGTINLYRYTDTDRIFFDFGSTAYSTALTPDLGRQTFTGTGIYDNSAAITTVTIYTDSGTLSGTMYVYGVS